MRQEFFKLLLEAMRKNPNIFFLTGDLGFGLADEIFAEFPNHAYNVGASEMAMIDMAIGLAYEGKIPFCYSITTFLLYRPFEALKTYCNHESLNVNLVGSGRNKSYLHDGISHWSDDAWKLFDNGHALLDNLLDNFIAFWPDNNEQMEANFDIMLENNKPSFISLLR